MACHVVNDCIDGVPVTVTYCDRTDCARVFTGEGNEALDVWTAGYMDGLMLRYNGRFFLQNTGRPVAADGPAPEVLPSLPHTRSTWKQWHSAHPDTDIYGTLGRKELNPHGG
jgi:hypothetical protein